MISEYSEPVNKWLQEAASSERGKQLVELFGGDPFLIMLLAVAGLLLIVLLLMLSSRSRGDTSYGGRDLDGRLSTLEVVCEDLKFNQTRPLADIKADLGAIKQDYLSQATEVEVLKEEVADLHSQLAQLKERLKETDQYLSKFEKANHAATICLRPGTADLLAGGAAAYTPARRDR